MVKGCLKVELGIVRHSLKAIPAGGTEGAWRIRQPLKEVWRGLVRSVL